LVVPSWRRLADRFCLRLRPSGIPRLRAPTITPAHRTPLNSDDHFDRPFLFMAVKGKPKRQKSVQQQLEQKTMTALHIGKSIYRSPLRRGLLLIILPALRRPLFHTSEQLAIRPIFLLLSTAAALLGAPLATQGTPV